MPRLVPVAPRPAVIPVASSERWSVETLREFYERIKDCRKCPLAKGRTQVVFGVGSENADLMFIGEAPGYYEDQQGEPFVGAAGQLLDKLLASIGLTRNEVYIANIIKCRPPQNRDPLPEEVEACKPYLYKQIEMIAPKIICTLGNHATRVLLNKNVSISRVHGRKFGGNNYYIFPIYHPAAALHMRTNLSALEEDFLKLKEFLARGVEPPPKEPEQMGLF